MIVCHCHGLTDRDIRRVVGEGAGSFREVSRRCGAGTGCGGCLPVVEQLVAETRPALAKTPDARAAR